MDIRLAPTEIETEGATLVAGVLEGMEPAPGSEAIFDSVPQEQIEASGFEGKNGQHALLSNTDGVAVLLVGLGDDVGFDQLRDASGTAIRATKTERMVTYLAGVDVDASTRAVVEGTALGGYQFRVYKSEGEPLKTAIVDVVGADEGQLGRALAISAATNLARDWINTPARDQSPQAFAASIEEAASSSPVVVEIWDRPRIEEEGLGAVLGVAAGSDRDPRVVVATYEPEGAKSHLALVGKGITFDSGGLSIKSSAFMEEMKDDMSGAATVVAATIAVANLGLPVRITCIAPLTDNVIGGNATRPGDVLKPVEGPSIEVLNTDAEGRLILADGLGLARRHDPDLMIDVATLTGAARVALGDKIAAVFGSDSDVSKLVLDAASRAGENFWELPLFREYRKAIDSNIADIKNISGSRYGGAIIAAVFLAEYAGDGRWAHLDIAGPARTRETAGENVKGASGVGVRTLVEVAKGMAESD